MFIGYTKNSSVAEVHRERKRQEWMLGGRGFVGQAKGFELNLRYNGWSLIQFMFVKERFGCCVENGLEGSENGGDISEK